jgi:hypothetical protein
LYTRIALSIQPKRRKSKTLGTLNKAKTSNFFAAAINATLGYYQAQPGMEYNGPSQKTF